MSSAVSSPDSLPETAVRNPSRYGVRLHRLDEEADEPQPACPEADTRDVDWNDVPLAAYYPNYGLCENPEWFGRDRR